MKNNKIIKINMDEFTIELSKCIAVLLYCWLIYTSALPWWSVGLTVLWSAQMPITIKARELYKSKGGKDD